MSTISQDPRIIKGTDPITVEHPVFLIYGQPGIGKSSLAFSAKDPILLNFDSESALARTVNRRDAFNVLTIERMGELLEDRSMLAPFQTVILDTAGCCVDLMAAYLIEQNPKYGRADGSPTQQGWGALKTRFRQWTRQLREMGKDLVLISHHKEDKNNDVVFVRPDITGGSKDEVLRVSDFVGFLYMSGRDRMLDFNPTEQWFGKNPAQWRAKKIPPIAKATTFLAQLIDEGRSALGKISEVSATLTQQADDWRANIGTFTLAEECNRAIPQIQTMTPTLKPQVAKMLMDHAASKGIVFDPEKKVFVEPKPNGQPVESFI